MKIEFGERFTSKDLNRIIEDFWEKTNNAPEDEILNFDLTSTSWISLEELNFLFGWLRYLILKGKKVYVNLPELNPSNVRRFRRVVSLWVRWKIYTLIPFNQLTGRYEYEKYFNITNQINKIIEIEMKKDELHQQFNDNNFHKIIPLNFLEASYQDDFRLLREILSKELEGIFKVEKQIEDLLNRETCYSPFQNKTLSNIITTELFLNVIHHSFDQSSTEPKECYLAVALSNKRDAERNLEYLKRQGLTKTLKEIQNKIQWQLKTNIENEKCVEEQDFYVASNGHYRNESFIEFSFLDFGKGIANTLKDKFNRDIVKNEIQFKLSSFENKTNIDTQVLEYAFLLQTSRNELKDNLRLQSYIPRGLYFLVEIVKRYNGMLIARSARGKVIFNFKNFQADSNFKKTNKDFINFSIEDSNLSYFQGTLYTIVIPAIKEIPLHAIQAESSLIPTTTIKYPYKYIDINEIFQEVLKTHTGELKLHDTYDYLFVTLNKILEKSIKERCILIFDFKHIDHSIVDTKLYYYICHHPMVTESSNAIIVNPPNEGVLRDIQNILCNQDVHLLKPIPCVISSTDIIWLGLKNITDEVILNNYWHYEEKPTIAASDFENFKWKDFEKLKGNIIQFDKFGNMEFTVPDFQSLWHYLKVDKPSKELEILLSNPDEAILLENQNENNITVYKTASNYYQTKFISFFNKLINFNSWQQSYQGKIRFGQYWANVLLDTIEYHQSNDKLFDFKHHIVNDPSSKYNGRIRIDKIVAVTLSSHLLAEELRDSYSNRLMLNQWEEPQLIKLTNYYEFYNEESFTQINKGDNVLIINDVISTGKLNYELYKSLTESPRDANVVAILSLVDTRIPEEDYNNILDNEYRVRNYFDKNITRKLISILYYYIPKYISIDQIPKQLLNGKIIEEVRINPVLNAPSPTVKKSQQILKKLIYNDNSEKDGYQFLRNIYEMDDSKNSLCVGHIENFGSHHPYFIDTKILFQSETGKRIIGNLVVDVKNLSNDITKARNKTHLIKIVERFERYKVENIEINESDKKQIDLILNQIQKLTSGIELKDNYEKFEVDFIIHASDSGFDFIKRHEFSTFLEKVGNKNDFQVIRMPRVVMRQEWGIPNIPDSYKNVFSGKRILILDSASCTGETLLNLIDSVCYLDVKKITVLSIITRIKDFQGEFFTRIHKINNNKPTFRESSIPIDMFFGVHFNLPHYLGDSVTCPHCKEIHDYNEFLYKTELPKSVEDYLKYSFKLLQPVKVNDIISSTKSILAPYLEEGLDISRMFQIRDELGKKEQQEAYNKYFKSELNLSAIIDNNNVENIDEFIGVLIHEPHLVKIIEKEYKRLYFKLKIIIDYNTLNYIPETDRNKIFKIKLKLKWDRISLLFIYSYFFEDEFFIESIRNTYSDMILDKTFLISLFKFAEQDIEEKRPKKFEVSDSQENETCLNFISYLIWIRQIHEKIEQRNIEELRTKANILFYILNDLRSEHYRNYFILHTNRIINKLVFHLSLLRIKTEKDQSLLNATKSLNKLFIEVDTVGSNHYNLFGRIDELKNALQNFKEHEIRQLWRKGLYESFDELKNITNVLKPVFKAYKQYPHYKYLFDDSDSLFSFISHMEDYVTKVEMNYEIDLNAINSLYYNLIDLTPYFFNKESKFYHFALNYTSDFVKLWGERISSIQNYTNFVIEFENTNNSKNGLEKLIIYLPIAIANYLIFYQIEVNLVSYAEPNSIIKYSWLEDNESISLKIVNRKKAKIDNISIKSSFIGISEWKNLKDFGIFASTTDLTDKGEIFETVFKIYKKYIIYENKVS